MSEDKDFTINAGTGNVVKNALDIERAIASYFVFLLYHRKSLADTGWSRPLVGTR